MIPARGGLFARVLLAAYVMAAALLPLAHHDVICHVKSSTHCTTCLTTSSGEAAASAEALEEAILCDAGRATIVLVVTAHAAPTGASSGRSPPSLG